jgi:dTDP-4-dehydrorhamnose reductase
MPHVESYLTPVVFAVDIANKTAALPGSTGDETITLTYTKDLAKFVVAALGLSEWHEVYHCYSEQSTFGHVVRVAEEATGG